MMRLENRGRALVTLREPLWAEEGAGTLPGVRRRREAAGAATLQGLAGHCARRAAVCLPLRIQALARQVEPSSRLCLTVPPSFPL